MRFKRVSSGFSRGSMARFAAMAAACVLASASCGGAGHAKQVSRRRALPVDRDHIAAGRGRARTSTLPPGLAVSAGRRVASLGGGHGRHGRRTRHEGRRGRARVWGQRRRRRGGDRLRPGSRISDRRKHRRRRLPGRARRRQSRTRSTSARSRQPRRRATCTSVPTASRRATRATDGVRRAFPGASPASGRRGTRSARRTSPGRSSSPRRFAWPSRASSSTQAFAKTIEIVQDAPRAATPRRRRSSFRAARRPPSAPHGATPIWRTSCAASPLRTRDRPDFTRARWPTRSRAP